MMAVPYLEHFLDSLETLPSDLTRNFTLMRDLDAKTEDLVTKINKTAEDYIVGVNECISNDRKDKLFEIHEMFEKAKVLSDDKVQLAMQTYEMVDKHIRRLDTELTKFDNELKEKHINTGPNLSLVTDEEIKKKSKGRVDKTRVIGFNPKNIIKSDNEKGRKKHDVKVETTSSANSGANITSSLPALMANSNEALDMPVDPNEPTYCLCHQVSYGEMIGCDNPDCPIEWFHFGCVGLTIKPKGKWFCPKCIVERKKK